MSESAKSTSSHKSPEASAPTPVATAAPTTVSPESSARISRLKTAFLYVLIGGLSAAAILAVVALLIGQFNSAILKALGTIFIFFTHALFILALLWADKNNQVGKNLLPTSILVLTFSNLITTTLGTWEIISSSSAWRAFGLYILIIGAVYIIVGMLRLRVAKQAAEVSLYTSIGFTAATVVALAPWVLAVVERFDPLYFRVVAALAIIATTTFLIGLILRGIAIGRSPELKLAVKPTQPIPGGLNAIYITLGTFAAIVWFFGFFAFIASGVSSTVEPARQPSHNRYS